MALVLKLTYFAIERAAEPVSELLERSAARSPAFQTMCVRLATWHSRIDYQKQVRRLQTEQKLAEGAGLVVEPGRAQSVPVDDLEPPPILSEQEATTRGAELLGEGFVMAVGVGLLLMNDWSDRRSEAEQQQTIEKNEVRIKTLEDQIIALRERVEEKERAAKSAADAAAASPPTPSNSWWQGSWKKWLPRHWWVI